MEQLFLPGWGTRANLYAGALPEGWRFYQPRSFDRSGSLAPYLDDLLGELDRLEGEVALCGHSMGAALAIAAAAARPGKVAGLVLVSPAGLPLSRPLAGSALSFLGQALWGRYDRREAAAAARRCLRHPLPALKLAAAVHELDLTEEMEAVRSEGIPSEVVGAAGDLLTTPAHCRRMAALLGGEYHELRISGGHAWVFVHPEALNGLLAEREVAAAD